MFLWIAFAALAAAVCLPLLLAMGRSGASRRQPQAADIYRDQLKELDRDVARGVVPANEADGARTEIARRLILADAAGPDGGASDSRLFRIATVAVFAMPLVALGIYLQLGQPNAPDQPLAARLAAPPDQADFAVQVARVEERLKASPNDGQGWELLAPVYLKLGRLDDAVTAYGNALRLLGSTADRQMKYGLAIVAAANGQISQEAVAAFQKAAALAPTDVNPRLYMALALEQQGKVSDAIAAFTVLLKDAPANAGWVPTVKDELAKLQALPATGSPPPAATASAAAPAAPAPAPSGAKPGPSQADIAAAQALSTDQQLAMINGMVSSLAARLDKDGSDAEGWAQLVRSYVVLGRTDDARAALGKARIALAADPAKSKAVEEAALSAGLKP